MNLRATVLGALSILLLAAEADATQVIYRTPRQLGQDASLVVDGQVASVRSYWNESRTRIFTEATVNVSDTYKGRAGATIRIVQMGGVVGNVRQTVHGALQWAPGEEVLLFLEPALPGSWQVAGFSQGKYRVERDPRTGRAFVSQAPPADVNLLGAPAENRGAPRKLALDKFIDQVFEAR